MWQNNQNGYWNWKKTRKKQRRLNHFPGETMRIDESLILWKNITNKHITVNVFKITVTCLTICFCVNRVCVSLDTMIQNQKGENRILIKIHEDERPVRMCPAPSIPSFPVDPKCPNERKIDEDNDDLKA